MEAAIAIIAIVVVLGGTLIWVAIANAKDAAQQQERRRQAEATGKARERYDKAHGKARGNALARARDWLRRNPEG